MNISSCQAVSFFVGALFWTLMEYILHRCLGHNRTRLGGFAQEHRNHHREGDYFMPLSKKALITFTVTSSLALTSSFVLDMSLGLSFTAGFTLFFINYEIHHKRAHSHAPLNAYGRWLRRHHFSHHFAVPRQNFGVTTPLWDLIFGTYTVIPMIRIPTKKAMVWLIDQETREILPQYANDYQYRIPMTSQKDLKAQRSVHE